MSKRKRDNSDKTLSQLSRREQEIMDIVYRKRRVSCSDVRTEMISAPSYSAVRAMINKLVSKEYLAYETEGKKYIYYPLIPVERVSQGAVKRLVSTFFGGSTSGAIVALIDDDLDSQQIREIEMHLKEKRRKIRSKNGPKPQR